MYLGKINSFSEINFAFISDFKQVYASCLDFGFPENDLFFNKETFSLNPLLRYKYQTMQYSNLLLKRFGCLV